MRIVALVLSLSLAAVASASAAQWQFRESEEDWGTTCFASVDVDGFGTVGFMGAPGGPRTAYLDGRIEQSSVSAKWTVGNLSWSADGGSSDYFGWHEFYELPLDLVSAASKGDEMLVEIDGGPALTVPLSGSGKAAVSFLACYGG